jgi:hypothetical protein
MVEPLRHRKTKAAATDMFNLRPRGSYIPIPRPTAADTPRLKTKRSELVGIGVLE